MGSGELRRALLAALGLALLAILAMAVSGLAGPAPERSKKPKRAPVPSIAYGVLLNSWGRWVGPREDGEPDEDVINKLIAAHPAYLRVTTPGNNCPRPRPEAKRCMVAQPGNPVVGEWLLRLREAGIKLGVGINAYYQKKRKRSRPARGVIRQACSIKKADGADLYDFIFLDFALRRQVLQKVINKIHSGSHCSAGGWRLIMTNDTIFHSPDAVDPAARVWIHAKRFSLLDPEDGGDRGTVPDWRENARAAAKGRMPAILARDRTFIRSVRARFPHSHAVLKLEVPYQTGDRFGSLSTRVQKQLLKRWAAAQRRLGFKMVFPLFVHKGGARHRYDSREEHTYKLQKRLLCRERPRGRREYCAQRG